MEIKELYQVFTQEILPVVWDWMQITFDYFIDLFSRYVIYLWVTELITLIALSVLTHLIIKRTKKSILFIKWHWWLPAREGEVFLNGFVSLALLMLWALCLSKLYLSWLHLTKIVVVPEIAVFEKIQEFRDWRIVTQ